MKKFLLIFPPSWYTLGPHIAIPSLAAQLRAAGYNTETADLNIEFFNDVLQPDYIKESLNKLWIEYQNLLNKQNEIKNDTIRSEKFEALHNFFINFNERTKNLPNVIQEAIKIIRDESTFYNPKKLLAAANVIHLSLQIISLRYFPTKFSLGDIRNPKLDFTYEYIKNYLLNPQQNIFLDYYSKHKEIIKSKEPDFIGISINAHVQIVPGLTLAYLLKKETNAHISIGGNYFTRLTENLKKYPELFELFADSFSYAEGENSIIELAEYIENTRPIEKVSNLIYKKDGEIIINPQGKPPILSKIKTPDYTDYDFSKYISPEVVIPVQINRGCYYKKCAFCDIAYGQTFTTKRIEDFINELKEYKQKYHTSYFYGVDESVHPQYLSRLSDAILKENLDVKFLICARLEDEFSPKLLKKIQKAGFIFIQWGVETGSKRVLDVMNKGIEFKNIKRILKDADNAGIWNHAFTIWDLPTETYKEAIDTINFIFKNNKIIHSYALAKFELSRHSAINTAPSDYKISIPDNQEDFTTYLDIINTAKTEEERNKIKEIIEKYHEKYFSNPFHSGDLLYHYVFLYLGKYGLKFVKKYKFKK